MGLNINTNLNLLTYLRASQQNNFTMQTAINRLSGGVRINSASDDAAGLSLSQNITMKINANAIDKNNTQTGIAMLNTADSALDVMTKSLSRMRDLAVQAANGVYSDTERAMLQNEADLLSANIKQTYDSAKFASKNLFTGSEATSGYAAAIAAGYDDAHIVTTAADFVSKISADLGGSFILASDIDMSALGTLTNSAITGGFSGQLEGNGYAINNLAISTAAALTNVGLFSQITGGTVQNLAVRNVSINAANSNNVGGLAGNISNSTITNSSTSGSITGAGVIGGLAGSVLNSTITYSHSTATVTGHDSIGGFLGTIDSSAISTSYATGNVSNTGGSGSGGFAGIAYGGTITNTYATGSVFALGLAYVGGFTGDNAGATITNSYTAGGTVQGTPGLEGGFTGCNSGSVDASNFFDNNLSADNGGLAVNVPESSAPIGPWDSNIWDKTSYPPILKDPVASGGTLESFEGVQIQVGTEANEDSRVPILKGYALNNVNFDISQQSSARASISLIESKMQEMNEYRSTVGANINRLQGALTSQDSRKINYSNANSVISDADIAIESAKLINTNILQNFSTSFFSQVKNLDRQMVIGLLDSL